MNVLVRNIQELLVSRPDLPLAVYRSVHEQSINNVALPKPLLVFIVSGQKNIVSEASLVCPAGSFVFLSSNYTAHIKNTPLHRPYQAIILEFDAEDFSVLPPSRLEVPVLVGQTVPELEVCMKQFVELAEWAPLTMLVKRKQELLLLLHHLGYHSLSSLLGRSRLSHQIHDLLLSGKMGWTFDEVASHLAMSPSTLRRKLAAEHMSFKLLKDRARLGLGLHLLQTSNLPISQIAERCAYLSPSRFTDSFKQRFGMTPRELRRTIVTDY